MIIKKCFHHLNKYGSVSLFIVGMNFLLNRSGLGKIFVSLIEYISRLQAPKIIFMLSGVNFDQAWTERKVLMGKILKDHFSMPINALEIGTWFGEGSTKIWINQLPATSKLYLIDSWRPYVSKKDMSKGWNGYTAMNYLSFSAIHNVLRTIFKIESQGETIEIILVRGGGEVLKNFKPELFDFIYIDGSHYYSDVHQDITVAKSLINKKFGIICGDDLEKLPSHDLIEFASQHLEEDFVDGIHPGVLKAVAEHFDSVNMVNGFWWIYCINNQFSVSFEKNS